MNTINNPILPGFNPDPCIVRVENDYYIAVSTFAWFPGVAIYHSKDLANWRLLCHALTRRSQLDMTGDPDSGGVWAPGLSYSNGLFYLVYSDIRHWHTYVDSRHYLVTAPDITGPWSEPVLLNSGGIDPSLFHDEDGRKWLVKKRVDYRKNRRRAVGIFLQEYSPQEERLIGTATNIFRGTERGGTEGPHIYKREGYYYLITAEGGTGYEHVVTMARAAQIEGIYQLDPGNPVLTSAGRPELELQKAGHGSLVQTPAGEWFMAFLCGRPVDERRQCNLGRETALERCDWTAEGWLRIANPAGAFPRTNLPGPNLPAYPFPPEPARDDFDAVSLSVHFQNWRTPAEVWLTLSERQGFLRLYGQESLASRQAQSLVARRLTAFRCRVETCLEFEPEGFEQAAGLICLYDTRNYFYLRVSHDEHLGKYVGLLTGENGHLEEWVEEEKSVEGYSRYYLRAEFNYANLQFFYSLDNETWHKIGPVLEAGKLSDEYVQEGVFTGFTGTMVGIACQDLSGQQLPADFDYFEYRPVE